MPKTTMALLGLLGVLLPSIAQADLMQITEISNGSTNGFQHSLFHAASSNNGQNGALLGRLTLDNSFTSYYDPETGQLSVAAIVKTVNGNTVLGTVNGASSDLDGIMLSDGVASNAIAGHIRWSFFFTELNLSTNKLLDHLIDSGFTPVAGGAYEIEMAFADRTYIANANSYQDLGDDKARLTLWGADGVYQGNGKFNNSILGLDLVAQMITNPEPSSCLLWGTIAAGGLLVRRRRRRNSQA